MMAKFKALSFYKSLIMREQSKAGSKGKSKIRMND